MFIGGNHGGGGGGGGPRRPNPQSDKAIKDFVDHTNVSKKPDVTLDPKVQAAAQKLGIDLNDFGTMIGGGGAGPNRMPIDVKVLRQRVPAGTDLLDALDIDPDHTVASASRLDGNGAMDIQESDFVNAREINHVVRHHNLASLRQNIRNSPPGTTTFIIGAHGYPGGGMEFNANDAPEIGAALAGKGIKKVILSMCCSGGGQAGQNLVDEISWYSGATVYAWDKTIWVNGSSMWLNQDGNLVAAVPQFGPQGGTIHAPQDQVATTQRNPFALHQTQ